MVSQPGVSFLGTGQVVWISDAVNKLSKSHQRQVASLLQERMPYEDAGSRFWLFVETLLLAHSRPVSLPKYCFSVLHACHSFLIGKQGVYNQHTERSPVNADCWIFPYCDMLLCHPSQRACPDR